MQPLCSLRLCGESKVTNHHRDTESTEVAQRKLSSLAGILIAVLLITACKQAPPKTDHELTVAAAADLTTAFEEIGREFQSATGTHVDIQFRLNRITNTSDREWRADGFLCRRERRLHQPTRKQRFDPQRYESHIRSWSNRLWTPKESTLRIENLNDLTEPEMKRIAIANPDHAPYGMAAREALQSAGIWESVKPNSFRGEHSSNTAVRPNRKRRSCYRRTLIGPAKRRTLDVRS